MNKQADFFGAIIEWFAKDYPDFFKMLILIAATAVAATGIYKVFIRLGGLEKRMTVVENRLDKITEVLNQNTATLQMILMYLVSKKEQKKLLRQKLKNDANQTPAL